MVFELSTEAVGAAGGVGGAVEFELEFIVPADESAGGADGAALGDAISGLGLEGAGLRVAGLSMELCAVAAVPASGDFACVQLLRGT
jgi:hypothetical protein